MSDSLKQYMEDHRRAVQLKQLDILKRLTRSVSATTLTIG